MTGPNASNRARIAGPAPSEEHRLYLIQCNGDPPTTRWLLPGQQVDIELAVRRLVDRLEVSATGIQVRPDTAGVVAIRSYFWVEGYGAPITQSATLGGTTVNVTATLVGVDWTFGDGQPGSSGGLGEAWPARSSISHVYRDDSGARPYTVTATLWFQPTYDVNGAAGAQPLPRFAVPISRAYTVHEVQAVRDR
jgi:hypothetical protein